jgi:large subunit ribosomal protein L3
MDTDGYNAVQVGYRVTKEKKLTKPEIGHLAKSELPPMRKLREFKVCAVRCCLMDNSSPSASCTQLDDVSKFEVGQQLKVEELFNVGDLVDVAGTSTGKGFQGTCL